MTSLLLGPPVSALAAPGDFDPSFDADGRVLSHFGGFEAAIALIVQSDGKLLAGGFSNASNPSSNDFALARYNPDGSLDTSFGTGGLVLTAFGGQEAIIALVQQADGKLVAAGGSNIGGDLDFALARYNPDGSVDPSFGVAGLVITGFGGGEERVEALIQQPDGKLVAAGVTSIGDSDSPGDFALARYNPDGSLDTGFGGDGQVLTTFPNGDDIALALVQQPDGKLVAAGATNGAFALVRYNPDGSFDTSFGNGGGVLTRFGGAVAARALVRQPDGKLVAAGESSASGARDFTLARYNPDGSLDTTFGVGGRVVTEFGNSDDIAMELVQQPDGKLVAAGRSNAGAAGRFDVALARYLPNGSLDASFGNGGLMRTDFASTTSVLPFIGLALQTDAKVATAGQSDASGDSDFALARYLLTDEQPQPPPTCGGRPATILGTAGADTMRGTLGRDVILGLAGNDTIRGLAGNDTICGGTGRDTLIGGDGNDRLFGVSGRDRLFGDRGRDRLDGGTGLDRCRGGQGRNTTIRCDDRNAPPPQRPQDPTPPPPNPCPPISNSPCGLE